MISQFHPVSSLVSSLVSSVMSCHRWGHDTETSLFTSLKLTAWQRKFHLRFMGWKMTMWNHKPEPDMFRKDMNLLKIYGVVNQNRPDMIIFIKLHEADLQGFFSTDRCCEHVRSASIFTENAQTDAVAQQILKRTNLALGFKWSSRSGQELPCCKYSDSSPLSFKAEKYSGYTYHVLSTWSSTCMVKPCETYLLYTF